MKAKVTRFISNSCEILVGVAMDPPSIMSTKALSLEPGSTGVRGGLISHLSVSAVPTIGLPPAIQSDFPFLLPTPPLARLAIFSVACSM